MCPFLALPINNIELLFTAGHIIVKGTELRQPEAAVKKIVRGRKTLRGDESLLKQWIEDRRR
jgi:hypothetical protein